MEVKKQMTKTIEKLPDVEDKDISNNLDQGIDIKKSSGSFLGNLKPLLISNLSNDNLLLGYSFLSNGTSDNLHLCEGLSLCLENVDGFPSKNKSVSSSHLGYWTCINKPNKSMEGYNLKSQKGFYASLDFEVDYVKRRNIN